jgi:hypothetical protein
VVPGLRPPVDSGRAASPGAAPAADHFPQVALARTPRGWAVIPVPGPAVGEPVADVVEGMTLADLVAEDLGGLPEPDRDARLSARGSFEALVEADELDLRIAGLQRTIAQLEHALSTRVAIERAIGVLAERNGTSVRTAFESMRREARAAGRPVVDLAHEVLDGLVADPQPDTARPPAVPVAATDGRS